MTEKAGPMRVISVMRSLVMAPLRVFSAVISTALRGQKQDDGFPLGVPGRASAPLGDQPQAGGRIFQAQLRRTAEQTWKARSRCQEPSESRDHSAGGGQRVRRRA